MLELLKQLITSGQNFTMEGMVPRQLHANPKQGRITIIKGARRTGKSCMQVQLMDQLERKGVNRKNMVHIDFSDARLRSLRRSSLSIILKAYRELYPNFNPNKEKLWFLLDEVQRVNNWPMFILETKEQISADFCLTSSTCNLLDRLDAQVFINSCDCYELFPFNFSEYLAIRGSKIITPTNDRERLFLKGLFERYLASGGMPTLVFTYDEDQRMQLMQRYVSGVIPSEIFDQHMITNPQAFTDCMFHILSHIMQTFTLRQLNNFLASCGHECHEEEVRNYLQYLSDSYFIMGVFEYSQEEPGTSRKRWKVLALDHNLSKCVSEETEFHNLNFIKNIVFMSLRQYVTELYFYRCKDGSEIDFYHPNFQGKPYFLMVCDEFVPDSPQYISMMDTLCTGLDEVPGSQGVVVANTLESSTCEYGGKTIPQYPINVFLIYMDTHIPKK